MLEIKEAIKVKGYKLVNPDKIQRALHGSPDDKGMPVGGVYRDGKYDDDELLVEYDRIGGLIRNKEGDKVRTGSFYNFTDRKAHDKPAVELEYRVNGELVFVKEGKPTPGIVRATQQLEKETKKKVKKAKK
jgi:hypothetical protein